MAQAAAQLSLGLASPRGRKRVRANRRPAHKLSWPARIRLILIGAAFLTTLAAASLGLVAGYQALAAGGLFYLKRVTLIGQERLDREQVLALAGLKEGQHLLELKPALIRGRLLASPWVAQARVRLIPPDEVRIHLVERRPAALVMAASPWFMDEEGVVFKTMEPGEWADLPVVTGLEEKDPRQAAGREVMERVREVLDLLSRPGGKQINRPIASEGMFFGDLIALLFKVPRCLVDPEPMFQALAKFGTGINADIMTDSPAKLCKLI